MSLSRDYTPPGEDAVSARTPWPSATTIHRNRETGWMAIHDAPKQWGSVDVSAQICARQLRGVRRSPDDAATRAYAARSPEPVLFGYGPQHRVLLHRVDVFSGAEPRPVPFLGDGAMQAAVSAARRHLVYTQSIWELRMDEKSSPSKLISSTYLDHVPRYSPDGQRIAFTSTRSGFQEIWVVRRDGSDPVQLTSFDRGESVVPVWSPDGRYIAFHRPDSREGSS